MKVVAGRMSYGVVPSRARACVCACACACEHKHRVCAWEDEAVRALEGLSVLPSAGNRKACSAAQARPCSLLLP